MRYPDNITRSTKFNNILPKGKNLRLAAKERGYVLCDFRRNKLIHKVHTNLQDKIRNTRKAGQRQESRQENCNFLSKINSNCRTKINRQQNNFPEKVDVMHEINKSALSDVAAGPRIPRTTAGERAKSHHEKKAGQLRGRESRKEPRPNLNAEQTDESGW